jgi:hypothetical protein
VVEPDFIDAAACVFGRNFYEKFFNPVYVASVLQGKKAEGLADIRKGIQSPPDVRIISPKPNDSFNTDTITIKVAAKDTGGGIDEIRLYHNGKALGDDQRGVKLVSRGGETVRNLLADIDFLGYDKIKLVMDRGFYSETNINDLYYNHLKFLIAAKKSLMFVKAGLDNVRDSIRTWTNYHQKHDLYACTAKIAWDYSRERPYKADILKGKRRMYMHIYFNSERALEDEKNFNALLCRLQEELESGTTHPEHDRLYAKYFDTTTTPVRGTKVIAREDALAQARKNYGFFVLLSNEVREPIVALEIYRNKDLVEKAFGNLKERLNFNRTAVSSDQSLDGKLFVEFIALIFLSYLKKKMQDGNLFKKYTMHELLDEMDIIECFEYPGYDLRVGEATKKQIEIYEAMGIAPPTSLH